MRGIFSEKNENDYSAQNMDGENSVSLKGLCDNSTNDSSGGNINLNTGFASTASGGANLDDAPYAMSEFRGYDHDASTLIHSTTFQPDKDTVSLPYQSVYHFSGFGSSNHPVSNWTGGDSSMNDITFPDSATFGGISSASSGAQTIAGNKIYIAYLYNWNNDGDSTNGETIQIGFGKKQEGSEVFSASATDWTSIKIYDGSNNSATLRVTLNRADADSATVSTSGGYTGIVYKWNASRGFSDYFGTNTTASSNDEHFIEIS